MPHHRHFATILTMVLLLSHATLVHAWSAAGHMISGAIAYSVLKKESPETLAKVVALLKKHPEYEQRWLKKLEADYVPEDQQDLYLFMLAARWPDDVRRGKSKKYDHPTWHYINVPFKPAGQPDTLEGPTDEPDNITRAYQTNLATLKGDASDEDKAIALCWLFHLVGDVHQPLHTTCLVTRDYPRGDKGGNLFFVRVYEQSKAIGLHQLWDGLLGTSGRFQTVRNTAIKLRNRPEFAKEELTELAVAGFDGWVKESFSLAKEAVYLNGQLQGSLNVSVTPVLPAGYTKEAKKVAERRIVLAGHRLAEVMKASFR